MAQRGAGLGPPGSRSGQGTRKASPGAALAEGRCVSVGQVQYYFPSKKELVAATHLHSVEMVRRLADEASGQDRSTARLESMFAVQLERARATFS